MSKLGRPSSNSMAVIGYCNTSDN